jgi:hypothetical protein
VGFVQHELVIDVRDPGDVRLTIEFRFEPLYRASTGVSRSEHDNIFRHVSVLGAPGYKPIGTGFTENNSTVPERTDQ